MFDSTGRGLRLVRLVGAWTLGWTLLGCGTANEPALAEDASPDSWVAEEVDNPVPPASFLRKRALAAFGALPEEVSNPENPITEAKVVLGRALYYETRLSKNHDISCNSCHQLDRYGVDNEATSPGHRGQRGDRNSPTVYNAALHIAQFWDGRAPDVEEQAKGPILNPVEMAMASEADVLAVLKSIPGYAPMFAAAFPDARPAISYDHVGKAIGAFERRLLTPSRFDAFMAGDLAALSRDEQRGLWSFLGTGCTTCHQGAGIGGAMYQKLGLVRPYPTEDPGRAAVTGNPVHQGFFKVPSLRNIEKTAPYFHDGSIATLDEAIRIMAEVQLGRKLEAQSLREIRTFLGALTGELPASLIARPELPASGPDTPAPDPR